MADRRQKRQVQTKLPFIAGNRGETSKTAGRVESAVVIHDTERPAGEEGMMEAVVGRENLSDAVRRVVRNRGGPGIDGMTVGELRGHLEGNWADIRRRLLEGTYEPMPVKRVEIPKPGGGVRRLGVPTVMDRLVQQMLLQVLQKRLDPGFSDHSYGFRPGRSAHQAVERAQGYIGEGYHWVVDMDLEKFFDRVNHDILMGQLARRVRDKRVRGLVRAFLNSGVMEGGLVRPTTEGTPQGGPLSPLLSNVMLDVLDRELERRGHRFARYADDCNIYVGSKRAGERVMASVAGFLRRRLKLGLNMSKSAVGVVSTRKFLGFSFTLGKQVKRRISPQSLVRFKGEVRRITRRSCGRNLGAVVGELSSYLGGWKGYFGFCETPSVLKKLDGWIRRRLRSLQWKQWKTPKKRRKALRRLGVGRDALVKISGSSKGPWHNSKSRTLHAAMPNEFFDGLGLVRLAH